MANEPEYFKRNTFTSYVTPERQQISGTTLEQLENENKWYIPNDMRNVLLCEPRLVANEQIVVSVPAYLCSAFTPIVKNVEDTVNREQTSVLGLLSVTNFKLSFVPLPEQRKASSALELYQEHLYLQRNDVTLNNIDHIYQLTHGSRAAHAFSGENKRKRIDSRQQKVINGRISALHIVCKNFRLLKFAFQLSTSGRDHGKHIVSALIRFAFTSRHELTFAYFYREPYYPTVKSVSMYTTQNDWVREILRCGANGRWRVYSTKENDKYENRLPAHFVIPQCIKDGEYLRLSRAFYDSRAPFWVYEYGKASLVRVAELRPDTQQDTTAENILLETVRKCNESHKLHRLQLTDCLPSIQDVQRAYYKFQRLCTPEESQQFLIQDAKFLTLLEKSNWLFYVSLCLRYSCEAAEKLRCDISCVLQETRGRDLCCVVSSLTQIILDPIFRTIDGFQSLVQKEWIALEHPFRTRLGHVVASSETAEDSESPIFLLFLDCVWQLLQQYPEEFEYSQTYLTTLWDSCFMPIFDTFQFDSNAERRVAMEKFKLVLRPVWDWREQFGEIDLGVFNNPFYQKSRNEPPSKRSVAVASNNVILHGIKQFQSQQQNSQRSSINRQLFATESTVPRNRFLKPVHNMSQLQIWEQCYYRWMPVLEIKNGGFPQIDFHHRILLSNISKLQTAIEQQDFSDLPEVYYQLTGEKREQQEQPDHSPNNDDSVEHRWKQLPQFDNGIALNLQNISSFFPFSGNDGETQQLNDILTSSNKFLAEGSVADDISISRQYH